VTQTLSRLQAFWLGVVVVACVSAAGLGLAAVAARQGIFAESAELTAEFPETHDVAPGTAVRIRGVEVGQVVAVDYPDLAGAGVTVRMRVKPEYANRLYADATARTYATGMLGAKVIAIDPGSPAAGSNPTGRVRGVVTPDLGDAAAKLTVVADEAGQLIKDARAGKGSVGKLLTDDSLYTELNGLAKDARLAVGKVDDQSKKVDQFVGDGRQTLKSVKQGTDAIQRMPIIRSYVEDHAAILVRPTWKREEVTYQAATLFEPGTAILTEAGKHHLEEVAAWLKGVHNDKAEVVIAARCDPADKTQTPASAGELTKKQAEVAVDYLKGQGVHKIGWWTRRKMIPLGLGVHESPIREDLPASFVQVNLYLPTS
jgi:phospholipid/cholesterol/gamma-HCH transport system substrate-binding protein